MHRSNSNGEKSKLIPGVCTIRYVQKFNRYEVDSGLTELSDAAAESLSKHEGKLDLPGLTELSDAAAESLSKHQGGLELSGLTELSDAAAESLSKHESRIYLLGWTKLSNAAAKSLAKIDPEKLIISEMIEEQVARFF